MVIFTSLIRNLTACMFIMLAFINHPSLAQTHLVKDIGQDPAGSYDFYNAPGMVDVNGVLFFTAGTTTYGIEVWKTNGTAEGTLMVKDIIKDQNSYSSPLFLTNVNGTLYFIAAANGNTYELWKSDGTEAGTTVVKTNGLSQFNNLTSLNGKLFFTAQSAAAGYELWMTDGTESGTAIVKDIYPGGGSGDPKNLTLVNGVLYFIADDGTKGAELWKSDGTEMGTALVKDIVAGSSGCLAVQLTNVNGTLYFSATDGSNGMELWKSNGTDAGTLMVKNIATGSASSNPALFTNANGTLFFVAYTSATGYELWKSDGTTAGTSMIKDIYPGVESGPYVGAFTAVNHMTAINGTVFFAAASDNVTNSIDLWKSDGTSNGTVRVKDITTSNFPEFLTNVNGSLFFLAGDETAGLELWKSDGTEGGTALFKDINNPGDGQPTYLLNVNGRLYFWAYDNVNGAELWKSDGTPASTSIVKNISSGTEGSSVYDLKDSNGILLFAANDEAGQRTLWQSDGTESGTLNLENGSGFENITLLNGSIYYSAWDMSLQKQQLWKRDIAGNVTALTASGLSAVAFLTVVNNTIYFYGSDGANHGAELWKTDGSLEGTIMVKDIRPGITGSSPTGLTNLNGVLYFSANDGINGTELWKCDDGTATGTVLVKDIFQGSNSSSPSDIVNVNSTLYFSANDDTNQRSLWKSDGTSAGTVAINQASVHNPYELVKANNTLYFEGYDETHGWEVWKSDGTDAGTVLIKDIFEGPSSGGPGYFTAVNGTVYFSADDGIHGIELWKSDGTPEGTVMVRDLTPGLSGNGPSNLLSYDNKLFFYLDRQLWKSEGDFCNTVSLTNTNDVQVTDWTSFVVVGNKLFFDGISEATGEELFYYDFSNVNTPGCTQTITFNALPAKTYGDVAFDLAATSSSGLQVSYTSSDANVATVNGTKVTIVGAGEATITASQAGDVINYSSALEVQQRLTVNKASATLALSDLSHIYNGSAKKPTAITTPSGLNGVQLAYKQGAAVVNAPVNAGTYDVTASLVNNNYSASPVTGTLTIGKATQTITFNALAAKTYGDASFDLSAVSTSGLTVTYTSSNVNVATVNGKTVTIVGAGSATITAKQSGNDNYEAASSAEQILTVSKKSQGITFASLSAKTIGDASFDLTGSATSGLAVTYTSSNQNVATVNGKTVTIVGAGSATITAKQSGNDNYEAAVSAEQLLTVNKKTQTISFASILEKILGEEPFTLVATSSSGLAITYTSGNTSVATISGNNVTIVGEGEAVITASQNGNEDFASASTTQTLKVKLITGIESRASEAVKVYPNPSSDFVIVATEDSGRGTSLALMDGDGKTVNASVVAIDEFSSRIEISHLGRGVYYLKISSGKSVVTKRIVKK